MRHSFRFPKKERLRARADFIHCYEHGKKYHVPHFILYAHHEQNVPERFGITVSRKVGNAVARNRIKRVLRECWRLRAFSLPGLQLVAIARKNATGICLAQAQAEFYPFFNHLRKCAPSS